MLGESLALGCAVTWAVSVILFKHSEQISPQGLNLFKNLVAVVLFALTMLVARQGIDLDRSTGDWLRLLASGVIGVAVADTLYFTALRRLGPAMLSVLECAYPIFVVLLAMLFLDERLAISFAIGASFIMVGIATATTCSAAASVRGTPPERRRGVVIALFGFACLAVGVVMAKPVLVKSSLIEVSFIRLVAGVCGQLVWILLVPGNRSALQALRPARVWRTLLPASVLGSYLSMILWLGGFKWAQASTAAVLNQMTTVFVIVLARIFFEEPITARRAIGAAIAVVGSVLVVV